MRGVFKDDFSSKAERSETRVKAHQLSLITSRLTRKDVMSRIFASQRVELCFWRFLKPML
jgi:hypothetical protein